MVMIIIIVTLKFFTSLFFAIIEGHIDNVNISIASIYCNVIVKCNNGNTAKIYAFENRYIDIAKYLINNVFFFLYI